MNVLVIAPHPDDEILGVGGTIKKRASQGDNVFVCVITKGYKPYYDPKTIRQTRREQKMAHQTLGIRDCVYLDFPTPNLDCIPFSDITKRLGKVVEQIKPSEVYVPHKGDIHFEHRITYDASMTVLRPKKDFFAKKILAYETVSETGWDHECSSTTFMPNVYEEIDDFIDDKIAAMATVRTQLQEYPSARSLKALRALAQYRGSTVGKQAAEAFILLREIK